MVRYSEERKTSILKKLLPPHNRAVPEVAREEGISDQSLYNWLKQARNKGFVVPGKKDKSESWSAEAKLATVIETATMTELELGKYCRSKGLYPEQIANWKAACLHGAETAAEQYKEKQADSKKDKKRIKELEKELRRKEKALAETAALLVLRKKLNALWEESEED
jgi:transposase-like protein